MEEKISNILSHREKKYEKIQFLKRGFKTVITVKANIPGVNKNISEAYILINIFKNLISRNLIENIQLDQGADGPSYIIASNSDAHDIKGMAITLEDTHFLGRFIDIDIFEGKTSLNRKKMRKCYICDKPALVCVKNQTHSASKLVTFIIDNVYNYFKNCIKRLIDSSILMELNLHPKFGLVTPITNGSHHDMNFDLMVKAKDAIIPYLLDMFEIGWVSDIENIFLLIRKIGLEAETEMFLKTKNINAYKGLIFNLGILVSAYGYVIHNNIDLNEIYNIVKRISVDVLNDFNEESKSFGYQAFKQYNILGARGEVYNGLESVRNALEYLTDFSDQSRIRTLMYLISKTDDTVLLKRCKSFKKYKRTKEIFKRNIYSDLETINDIDQNCIKENLSFGGSADLLILSVFLRKIGL